MSFSPERRFINSYAELTGMNSSSEERVEDKEDGTRSLRNRVDEIWRRC